MFVSTKKRRIGLSAGPFRNDRVYGPEVRWSGKAALSEPRAGTRDCARCRPALAIDLVSLSVATKITESAANIGRVESMGACREH